LPADAAGFRLRLCRLVSPPTTAACASPQSLRKPVHSDRFDNNLIILSTLNELVEAPWVES
jgi:hypothetical protein